MNRLHEIAQLSYEDEFSRCLKLAIQLKVELAISKNKNETRNQSQSISDQEQNIDSQLSMSKPLVTEIMEFFYNKEKESSNEKSLDEVVGELQAALESCLEAEEKFQKAAFYNP